MDAAFGLWAGVSDKLKHLIDGIEQVDSCATDAHKWLNVPYDCGLVFIKKQQTLFNPMAAAAAYLPESGGARMRVQEQEYRSTGVQEYRSTEVQE